MSGRSTDEPVVPGRLDAFTVPMVADPGTRFVYGINTDWLGRVVEAVTGKGLDVVVKEAITGPLGMDSTSWAGLFNTHFWIDRTTGICASIYSNSLPFIPPEALQLYLNYETALYAAL